MAPMIQIDDEVFGRLKAQAEPFVDSPNSVLRRLMGLRDSPDGTSSEPLPLDLDPGKGYRGVERGQHRRRNEPKPSRKRAQAGSILPEREYEEPLLEVLVDAGGQASSRAVTEAVGQRLADRLTDLDKEPLKSGDLRWRNRLQFVRLRLIERGLMAREAPRGVWVVSDAGRRLVESARGHR